MSDLAKKIPIVAGHCLALMRQDYQARQMRSEAQIPEGPGCLETVFQKPDVLIERNGTSAIISIKGAIAFDYGVWNYLMGDVPTSQVTAAISQVAADEAIEKVLIHCNCPGGSVAGSDDLWRACDRLANSGKQVDVLAHECLCSLAYGLACRATTKADGSKAGKILTTPTADVGSIGTVILAYDTSRLYENMGVKVMPISSGKLKGAGADGMALSAELIATYQARVDAESTRFAGDVARARGMTVEQVLAFEGGYWHGTVAVEKGLADAIVSADETLAKYRGDAIEELEEVEQPQPGEQPNGDSGMADENKEVKKGPVAASLEQLKKIWGSDATSMVASMEAGHTVEQAQEAKIKALEASMEESNKKAAEAEAVAKNKNTLPKSSNTAPISTPASVAGSLVTAKGGPACIRPGDDHEFMQAARQYSVNNNCSLDTAIINVASANPGLHAEYLKAMPRGRLSERKTA